ncbi:MAG: hypothetical protein Q9174_006899, partial [Haloplaca sp. 1 TL-2023]
LATLFPMRTSGKFFQQEEPSKSLKAKETKIQRRYRSSDCSADWRADWRDNTNTSQSQLPRETEKSSLIFGPNPQLAIQNDQNPISLPVQTSFNILPCTELPQAPTPEKPKVKTRYWSPTRLLEWRNHVDTSDVNFVKGKEAVSQFMHAYSLIPIPPSLGTTYPDINLRRSRRRPITIPIDPNWNPKSLHPPTLRPKDEDAVPPKRWELLKPIKINETDPRSTLTSIGRTVDWDDSSDLIQLTASKPGTSEKAECESDPSYKAKRSIKSELPTRAELIASLIAKANPRLTMTSHRVDWHDTSDKAQPNTVEMMPNTGYDFSVDPPVKMKATSYLPVYKRK